MLEQRNYLRHDLTALYAFIESIVEGVVSQRNSTAYSPAAIRFLTSYMLSHQLQEAPRKLAGPG